jgi:hypothetical protein
MSKKKEIKTNLKIQNHIYLIINHLFYFIVNEIKKKFENKEADARQHKPFETAQYSVSLQLQSSCYLIRDDTVRL